MDNKKNIIILLVSTVIIIGILFISIMKPSKKDIQKEKIADASQNRTAEEEEIVYGDPGEVSVDGYDEEESDAKVIPTVGIIDSTKELENAVGLGVIDYLSRTLPHMSEEIAAVKNAQKYTVMPGSVNKGNTETEFVLVPDTAPDVKITIKYNLLYGKFAYKIDTE